MFMYTVLGRQESRENALLSVSRVTRPETQRALNMLGPQPPLELCYAQSLLLGKMAFPDIATRMKDMLMTPVLQSNITVNLWAETVA